MPNKKNILMLIPNLGHGGAQKSFSQLSIILNSQHNVTVVYFDNSNPQYPIASELMSLHIGHQKTLLNKIKAFRNRIKEIKAIKKAKNIDVCISFLEGANYINVLSKQTEKVIISVRGSKIHDQNIRGWQGKLRRQILIPKLYKKAHLTVAISKGLKQELIEHFHLDSNNVKTIYNGFNADNIESESNAPLPNLYTNLFNKNVIINHGRLAPEKGHQHLIRLFKGIYDSHPNARLVFIGDGPTLSALKFCVKTCGLSYQDWHQNESYNSEAHVHFIPFQTHVFSFIKASKLFISSSLHEGFGRSIIEAMICRTPVIANDCPYGPKEIIVSKEYGIVLPDIQKEVNAHLYIDAALKTLKSSDRKSDLPYKRALQFDVCFSQAQWLEIIN